MEGCRPFIPLPIVSTAPLRCKIFATLLLQSHAFDVGKERFQTPNIILWIPWATH